MTKKAAAAGKRTATPPAEAAAPKAASQGHRSTTANKPPAQTGRRNLKVKATAVGFYDNERKRPGDVFVLTSEAQFSSNWMEYVDAQTPLRQTTSQQALNQKHDEILGGKTGTVAGGDDDNPLDA